MEGRTALVGEGAHGLACPRMGNYVQPPELLKFY